MSAETPLTLDSFPAVTLEDWRRQAAERLGDRTVEDLGRSTADGVDLQALYTAADRGEAPELPQVGGMLRDGSWSVCARLDEREPLGVAAEIAAVGSAGADAVWLRFDRAARLGMEADADTAPVHLGVGGAVLHHLADLDVTFEGAALGGTSPADLSLWLDAGGNALPATAGCLAALERQECELKSVVIHCGADPLGALAADGRLPRDLMKLESEMAVLARFSSTHLAGSRAISVSTLPYHRAGATIVQELAYAVATTGAYLAALERSGLEVESAAEEIALRFGVGNDLFVEIAKLRAARLLWAMQLDACGVTTPPAALVHVVGSERALSRLDPWNNLLRSTGQAFAAVCGGADAVTLLPFDAALGETSERARRLACTAQRVLADEAGLGRVIDPTAGSYAVEALTRQLAAGAWALACEIEATGGMRDALLAGRIAAAVAESAAARQRETEEGTRPITGVTAFARPDEAVQLHGAAAGEALRDRAVASLVAHRRAVRPARASRPVSHSRDFVVDELVAAAAQGSTLAELGARLGDARGAESIHPLPLRRDAAPFEPGSATRVAGEEE